MNELKLCWNILPRVSRSFSLCIKLLPKPLDKEVMISYLIFRVIDTIEDSLAKLEYKKELFDEFIEVLSSHSYNKDLTLKCEKNLMKKLNFSYESILLKNLNAVIKVYFSFPETIRKNILKYSKESAQGMYKFQKKNITTFNDQDEYCYYVAGIVGYLLTDIFYHNKVINKRKRDHLMKYARNFGLALQKVNIIRDIAYDIPGKRYYWPKNILKKHKLDYNTVCIKKNRGKALVILNNMIKNALPYLKDALYYTTSLPKTALKVRVFCLIPLFMSIKSFVKCINNENVFIKDKKVKISREEVKKIVKRSYIYSLSNILLNRWYDQSMKQMRMRKWQSKFSY